MRDIGGLEDYGRTDPITGFDPVSQQLQIFPSINSNLAEQWEFNFGLSFGMSSATDHLNGKMILGYRFNF